MRNARAHSLNIFDVVIGATHGEGLYITRAMRRRSWSLRCHKRGALAQILKIVRAVKTNCHLPIHLNICIYLYHHINTRHFLQPLCTPIMPLGKINSIKVNYPTRRHMDNTPPSRRHSALRPKPSGRRAPQTMSASTSSGTKRKHSPGNRPTTSKRQNTGSA